PRPGIQRAPAAGEPRARGLAPRRRLSPGARRRHPERELPLVRDRGVRHPRTLRTGQPMTEQVQPPHLTRRRLLAGAAAFLASLLGRGAAAQPLRRAARFAKWNERMEVAVNFEINQAISLVHRPYVAVTIEDTEGGPVR